VCSLVSIRATVGSRCCAAVPQSTNCVRPPGRLRLMPRIAAVLHTSYMLTCRCETLSRRNAAEELPDLQKHIRWPSS